MTTENETPPTVLIVEDEANLLELFDHFLSSVYDTRTANRGEEALELLDDSIDVALLDRRIPDKSGDEVLRAIRDAGYRFPVAMLTAVEPDVDIIDMEFDDYICKPVDKEPLLNRVEVLVQRSDFDKKSREFFQLASKKAAIEANEDVSPGQEPEFNELVERMEALEADLDRTLQTLLDKDPAQAFKSI